MKTKRRMKVKTKIKSDPRRILLKKYMSSEYGMTPYNACIKAGYDDEFAKKIDDKMKVQAMFGYTFADIAEQEGWTPRKSIRMMIGKAGHLEGVPAVQKVISAQVIITNTDPDVKPLKASARTTDFVEVPDEDLILKYENKLWEITGHAADNPEANNNNQSFNLIINLTRPADPDRYAGSPGGSPFNLKIPGNGGTSDRHQL